jgi:hypothetical protein
VSDQVIQENNALRKNNERLTRENSALRARVKLAEDRATRATVLAQGWRLKIAELRGEDIGELQLSELKPPE